MNGTEYRKEEVPCCGAKGAALGDDMGGNGVFSAEKWVLTPDLLIGG